MNQNPETAKERSQREMMTHLRELQERCEDLLAARDPFGVYNSVQGLKSLVGQVDAASKRYRQIA